LFSFLPRPPPSSTLFPYTTLFRSKPFVGDRAYDATQHLLNCERRMRDDPIGTISRFADLLELEGARVRLWVFARTAAEPGDYWEDRKSTRLNSSHSQISYAVFCLK